VRIGLLAPSLGREKGGAEAVAEAWASELHRRGHYVTCLLYGTEAHWPPGAPYNVERYARNRSLDRWLRLPAWVRAATGKHRLDVVVGVLSFSNITLLRAFSLRGSRPALVVSEHSVPDLLWIGEGTSGRLKRLHARLLYHRADAIIAVSHSVATDLRVVHRVPPERLFVLPNAIDFHDKATPATQGRPGSAPRLVFVGRLSREKRIDRFADTLVELRRRGLDWQAIVIGDGPARQKSELRCAQHALPIEYVGWVDRWQSMAQPEDILLLTSDVEGLSNVLIEAAAVGIPSVAPSSALGVADAMIPGVTGILAQSSQASDLADAVLAARALVPNPVVAQWLRRFTPNAVGNQLESILSRAIARHLPDTRRAVTHVGPMPGIHGGIGASLQALGGMPFSRYAPTFAPSWTWQDRFWGLRPFLRTLSYCSLGRRSRVGVLHAHLSAGGSFVREGALVLVAAARGLPVVVTLHSSRLIDRLPALFVLESVVLRSADRIVVLGETTLSRLPASLRSKGVVVPNAVERRAFPSLAGSSEEIVLFAGGVSAAKGIDVLLEAWRLVRCTRPHARLVLAGPLGDVDPGSEASVEVLGPVTNNEVQRLLTLCRVAVLPSRREVLPMFVLEAMASARPVVATDVGEVADAVGDAGILVPVERAEDLAQALIAILAEPDIATRLGDRGRARVEKRFSPQLVVTALEEVYRQAETAKQPRSHREGAGS
jgi:glycosyltransferase involved in cell wall biosynthesis